MSEKGGIEAGRLQPGGRHGATNRGRPQSDRRPGSGRREQTGRHPPTGSPPQTDRRPQRGRAGEAIALHFLEERSHTIIETNYRSRYGEIDIIARRGDLILFVEVKARRDKQFGEPFEAVGSRKQAQIRRMAAMWLAEHGDDPLVQRCRFRFDVISIMLDERDQAGELLYIEDAFW